MFRAREVNAREQLSRETLSWILFAQTLCLLPLFFYLPLWLPVFWLTVTLWRIQIFRGVWVFPNNLGKMLLAALCVGLLLLTFRGRLGVEPMVSFLICGFVLKLVEIYKRKDAIVLLYICFVALGAQFLFSQNVLAALYVFICLWGVIAALRSVHISRSHPIGKQLKQSAILIAQSLPLMLLLFIVMPRLGQLWAVPSQQSVNKTGFSDTMSPGTLSGLIKSRELAFRVTFESSEGETAQIPPPRDRYWRGLVLEYYNGESWRQRWLQQGHLAGSLDRRSATPRRWQITESTEAQTYRYSIILEPHNQHWLFAMMTPTWLDSPQVLGAGYHEDKLLATNRPVSSRVQYKVESSVGFKVDVEGLSRESLTRNLQLPNNVNPRAQDLVENWLQEGLSQQQIIDAVLRQFNQEFTYTLNPPLLGANSVDEFLFITRRGFCEHFASSFVYLMRLAKIPARVVVGYQGGEVSTVENYLMVRQSDAHAWAEVWLPGEGWTRIDPTAAVAPSRIEQGLQSAVAENEAALLGGGIGSLALAMHYWDLLGYKWHRLVLSYDDESQRSVFEKMFGGTELWRLALWFVGLTGGSLAIIFVFTFLGGKRKHKHVETRSYQIFLKKLARNGLARKTGETPTAFAERAVHHYPQWQGPIERITRLYTEIAYRNKSELQTQLAREVRQFPR